MMESVRHAVLLRSAGTALAVERCRLAHGRLPEKLEDLVPEFLEAVPVDPFTRASLMYRPEGPGYLIYSLGTDRDDDGGVPEKAAQWGVSLPPQGDLSFRVDHPGPEE